jgi:hypothetical protein
MVQNLCLSVIGTTDRRGCSSNGRAPALHAGGTGIDTLLLHTFFGLIALLARENTIRTSFWVAEDTYMNVIGALAQW